MQMLEYNAFNNDFGPLKISCVYQYVSHLKKIMQDKANQGAVFWHITSTDPKKYVNSVFLMCSFQIMVLKRNSDQALKPFEKFWFPGFKDSSSVKN